MTTNPTSERLLTIDEFLALPPDPWGRKMELDDGRLVIEGEEEGMYGPGRLHGELSAALAAMLREFVKAHGLGSVMAGTVFVLDETEARGRVPDVAFLAQSRIAGDPVTAVYGAPTLAIEVISPSEKMYDVRDKVRKYLNAGTDRVWVVLPLAAEIYIYRRSDLPIIRGIDGTLTSDDAGFEIEGFELPLRDLFA